MKQTAEENASVMTELDDVIHKCTVIGRPMVVLVPSYDLAEKNIHATRQEIKDGAAAVLKDWAPLRVCVEKSGSQIRISSWVTSPPRVRRKVNL